MYDPNFQLFYLAYFSSVLFLKLLLALAELLNNYYNWFQTVFLTLRIAAVCY